MNADEKLTYAGSGVDVKTGQKSLKKLLGWIDKTFALRDGTGSKKIDVGFFANVVEIGGDKGLAVATDGVGTKIIVAQMMRKFDTIGIDCIAMNVNDLICVGAEPICILDYLAVQSPKEDLLEQIGKGLYEGCKQAKVTIPGGELAQVKEMIAGDDDYGFDLVAAGMGLVPLDSIIIGEDIQEKDVVIGLRSSGLHSNGYSLARKVFFEAGKYKIDTHSDELGCAVGEELLKPTHIYVQEIMEIINSDINIKALANITGDGLLNMTRVKSEVGYVIDRLPEPNPVFGMMQKIGNISDEEMFLTFNMGIGFCIICPEGEAAKVTAITDKYDVESFLIGYAVKDPERKVLIPQKNLIGKGSGFYKG